MTVTDRRNLLPNVQLGACVEDPVIPASYKSIAECFKACVLWHSFYFRLMDWFTSMSMTQH